MCIRHYRVCEIVDNSIHEALRGTGVEKAIGENEQGEIIMIKRNNAHMVAKSHRTSNDKELIRWANNDGILRK